MFITPTHLTSVISDFFQYLALILLTCSYTVPKSVCLPAYCLCDISDLFSTPIDILSSNSHHLVTNLVLLATQQANKSRDKLLEQGIMTLCGSQQTEKMVDQCPKEPSYLRQNSGFFLKGEGVWLVVANFLVPESFVLAAVLVGLVTMFL